MTIQQSLASLVTPLKDDALSLRVATYTESLGNPFTLDIELISGDENVNFAELLGKSMTLSLETKDSTRHFNGIITEFSQKENFKRNAIYEATLRPWFWLLTLSQKCRIFQQKSYPDIIKSVFAETGFTDFEDKLSSKYPKQEYIVQFNESDFDFISRIMQQEGIFYTFEHSKNKHTLVLHDDNARVDDIGNIDYYELDDNTKFIGLEGIRIWERQQQVKTGGVALSSFDFEMPNKNLKASTKDPQIKSMSVFSKYAYDSHFTQRKEGEYYTKLLMERENASHLQASFSANHRELACGSKFTLAEHGRDDQNKQHLITYFQCTIRSKDLVDENKDNEQEQFECDAKAIPANINFRPQQQHNKPKMNGPQTATVVGKKKEEIWTDKYGRVKVQFHWDEISKGDENSSCWIRVSQSMAGKNWGGIYIPRVGQEVLVDFLQGDPDQPIIIGCVFNGTNLPPYALPKHSTMTGFRSRSTKNAGTFTEIRIDDEQGDEQLFIHAAKNKDESVTNDSFESVGRDTHVSVGQDQHCKVKNNRFENIGADCTQKVGKDFNLVIEGKEAKEVKQSLSLNVKGNGSHDYEGSLSINADKDLYIKSDNICLDAGNNLTLKVGSSFVAIERGGITISSPGEVSIESKAALNVDAGATLDLKAGGAASIKGASVKIN